FETGTLNPYLYQGDHQKYFIGTGDYIKGISLDTSNTNSVLNAFGVIYFLSKKNSPMMALCMATLLLTGSNITNILLGLCLVFIFIFQSDRDRKSLIVICFLFLILFLVKVTPQNIDYVTNILEKNLERQTQNENQISSATILPKSGEILSQEQIEQNRARFILDSLSASQKKVEPKSVIQATAYQDRPKIPTPDIHTDPYQHKSVETPEIKNMKAFVSMYSDHLPLASGRLQPPALPGKIIAWKQTFEYFKRHPYQLITGTGIGNFSSKLAFKSTGLDIAGKYPKKYIYLNDGFIQNHLDLYLYYFTREDGFHSIMNNSNSVYDQLVSEYGLAGFLAFFILYIGYFIKRRENLTYGIPLLFLLSVLFFVEYWFEQLSVVVIFEMLMFLNLKKSETK
ncbi:MAG: hypothetical protein ABIN48_12475, partial [Ginsengibacter sp.]